MCWRALGGARFVSGRELALAQQSTVSAPQPALQALSSFLQHCSLAGEGDLAHLVEAILGLPAAGGLTAFGLGSQDRFCC